VSIAAAAVDRILATVPGTNGGGGPRVTVHGERTSEDGAGRRVVRALLADGAVVRMRELDNADVAQLTELYGALPAYDRALRYFSAGTAAPVESLLAKHHPGDVSLGAFRGDVLVGVAHAVVTDADQATAEIAMAVAHPEQAHGVGTLLLEHLASRARERGVRRFIADVLIENARMWQVIRDSGLPVRRHPEGGQARVEFDLTPAAGYLEALAEREQRADVASLAPLLTPSSVVVIGAGRRPDSVGHAVLANVLRSGFPGRLAAVNPHAKEVCGLVSHRSIGDVPGPPDLAVLCVPAAAVPEVARQCGRAGVRALLVISSGLSARPDLAAGLLAAVRRYDLRMVGPNCLGISNTDPAVRLDATFAGPAPAGGVGLVTQSGGVTIAVQLELGRLGLGLSTGVSTGDKYDVSGNDLLLWWHDDPRTRMAVLYLESFGNPRKFSRFARRLAARMPVLTVRSGSSAAGQRAAASHTASTATPRVTRDALFRQAGVLAVDRLDELSELIATLSWQPLPAGRRVGVISNAGGAGVLAADACEANGLAVPTLGARTRRVLRGLLPAGTATGNPVDTSATIGPAGFAAAVAALRADHQLDAVLAVTVPTALGDPSPGIARAAAAGPADTPLLAVRLGQPEHVCPLPAPGSDATVPSFADPAAAAAALARAATRAAWLARPAGAPVPLAGVDPVRAGGPIARFLAGTPAGGWLDVADVQQVLEAFGLPVLRAVPVADAEQAVAVLIAAGRPVAIKAVADGVLHKAAAGGVRLGLPDPAAVATAASELADRFGARLRGLLVQPMAPAGPELLVGVTGDPVFGPLVTVGLGGTSTDLVADRAHRLVPLSDVDADEMLGEFRAGDRLFGPRGRPTPDRGRVRDVVVRIGRLAETLPEVVELDLNPVIVGPDGAVVVDARIRVMPAATGDPALRALAD
jgi:acyl-CoA synthetase (NDP forming)/GNAT superfamily N-acetyltransferase